MLSGATLRPRVLEDKLLAFQNPAMLGPRYAIEIPISMTMSGHKHALLRLCKTHVGICSSFELRAPLRHMSSKPRGWGMSACRQQRACRMACAHSPRCLVHMYVIKCFSVGLVTAYVSAPTFVFPTTVLPGNLTLHVPQLMFCWLVRIRATAIPGNPQFWQQGILSCVSK